MKTILGNNFYTATELQDMIGVSDRTLRIYLKSGQLLGRKIGGTWHVSEENLNHFLNGRKAPAEACSAA